MYHISFIFGHMLIQFLFVDGQLCNFNLLLSLTIEMAIIMSMLSVMFIIINFDVFCSQQITDISWSVEKININFLAYKLIDPVPYDLRSAAP